MINITKQALSLWVVATWLMSSAFAQAPEKDFEDRRPPGKEVQQKMKELHEAFVSDRLDLTEKEKKAFIPIFRQMKEEEKAMMEKMRTEIKALRKKEKKGTLAETEANKLLDKILERKEQKIAVHKKYLNKMRAVLPAAKLVKLEQADRRFRGEVMSRFKDEKKKHRKKHRPDFPDTPGE